MRPAPSAYTLCVRLQSGSPVGLLTRWTTFPPALKRLETETDETETKSSEAPMRPEQARNASSFSSKKAKKAKKAN